MNPLIKNAIQNKLTPPPRAKRPTLTESQQRTAHLIGEEIYARTITSPTFLDHLYGSAAPFSTFETTQKVQEMFHTVAAWAIERGEDFVAVRDQND